MLWSDRQSSIINNLIISNSGKAGGGIAVFHSSPAITNNTIAFNTASNTGAAIFVGGDSNPSIKYNLAYYNDAPPAGCGGIECWPDDEPILECNDSWNNFPAGSDYGGLVGSYAGLTATFPRISYSAANM